jgi:flagellar biosynthesis chaperone FliJ
MPLWGGASTDEQKLTELTATIQKFINHADKISEGLPSASSSLNRTNIQITKLATKLDKVIDSIKKSQLYVDKAIMELNANQERLKTNLLKK